MEIQLSHRALARLTRPVNGEGGFQSLLRHLQPQISGTTLTVSATDLEKLQRYSYSYGEGGFQWRTEPTAQLSFDFLS